MMLRGLLLFLLVLIVVWRWRTARAKQQTARPPRRPSPQQAMVECAHCGVHVPVTMALRGSQGMYCCAAHLQSKEP
jgi:uncharacterized protein